MENPSELPDDLENKPVDYIVPSIKGTIGLIPGVGPLLSELVGVIVPNQRMDRIAKFSQNLETKLSRLEEKYVHDQLKNELFSDLLEEGVRQAAQSLSDERRECISNLIANSLSQQEIDYIESKHLLKMLGELNDIEVIWLRSYLIPYANGDREFREKHSKILSPVIASMADPPSIHEKEKLQDSYAEHLARLGLIRARYEVDRELEVPVFDRRTGAPNVRGYEITTLGRILLKQIGLGDPDRS